MTDERTKPIKCVEEINCNDNTFTYFKAIPNINTSNLSPDIQKVEIQIGANALKNNILETLLDSLKNKWFVNLTLNTISHKVQYLLQLGKNFFLPLQQIDKGTIELIKCIKGNIETTPRNN